MVTGFNTAMNLLQPVRKPCNQQHISRCEHSMEALVRAGGVTKFILIADMRTTRKNYGV